jgi:hypothetical protein
MKKSTYITAAILLVTGLAVAPAFAQKAPMKGHPPKGAVHSSDIAALPATQKSTMPMKAHHSKSCYDYAWDSQAQKDCLAGKSAKPMAKKSVKKAAAPKI